MVILMLGRPNSRQITCLSILTLLLVNLIPIQLIISDSPVNTDSDLIINPLSSSTIQKPLERLVTPQETKPLNSQDDPSSSTFVNISDPMYAIGSQSGIGGGIVEISDSFSLTGINDLSTQNYIINNLSDSNHLLPSIRETDITIPNPAEYTKNQLLVNISSIIAEFDWRLRENYVAGRTPWNSYSDDYKSVAMAFEVEEDYVNISKVQINNDVEGSPTGIIYIVNATSGEPDNTKRVSSIESLIDGSGWREYTFDENISLEKGLTYYIVMNVTSQGASAYWEWRNEFNNDYGTDAGKVFVVRPALYSDDDWHEQVGYDLPVQIRVLPVEKSGSDWIAKDYSSPNEVEIKYNNTLDETILGTFTWFEANNTEIHNFKSNTSISFTLNFLANYTYSLNPLTGVTTYKTQNNSLTFWNVTFSTAKIDTDLSIRNHTVRIQGIELDWNGTQIFWNDSTSEEYANLNNNANVTLDGDPDNKYTNGSSVMYVNASILAENTTWHVWFVTPNYLLNFNLSRGGSYLSFPYESNVTDTLNINIEVPESSGNASYWIEDFNGQKIHSRSDFSSSSFTDQWIINDNVSQITNVNGSYDLQSFWHNSDKTKVGTFTRNLNIYIETNLSVQADAEVIIGQLFNITTLYKSVHNNTNVQNAKIWCNSSWPAINVTMNEAPDHSYNISLDTSTEGAGSVGTVIITTQVGWFLNWTDIFTVRFVEQSYLDVNTTPSLSLEWRENSTLKINYTDTTASGIAGASINVDGDTVNAYWDGIDEVYLFRFNSTKYNGVGVYNSLSITATHSDYLNQEWIFNLDITEGITNITARVNSQTITNDTTVYSIAYANSALDQISINLQYYHVLSGLNLSTVQTAIESPFPVTTSGEIADLSFNAILNPNQTGNYLVNFTFSLTNYSSTLFVIHITIDEALTELETSFVNGTNVLYEEFHEFDLVFNNTDYNEKINFNGNDTILINASQYISWLNRTADSYWFRFAYISLGVGSYAIVITFQHEYYTDASILLLFTIIPGPTTITGTDAFDGSLIINNTKNFTRNFSPNEFDSFSISLNYSALVTTQTIPLDSNNITIELDSSIYVNYYIDGFNNWTFTFNGSLLGSFVINITFSHFNYSSSTFTLFYTIIPADSDITASSQNLSSGTVNATIKSGNLLYFFLVWESEFGEYLNDSNGVISNDTALVFTGSVSINGTHYFLLTAGNIGTITVKLDFETENYSMISIYLRFAITDRALDVDEAASTHINGFTNAFLQYGDTYYFIVTIVDLDSRARVNASVSVNPSVNITFMNETNGQHLFQFNAWQIGSTGSLTIQFTKANYELTDYIITFVIVEASSQVVSPPTSLSLYLSQNLTTSMIWQSIPNPLVNTSPTLKINSTYITITPSSPLVIFSSVNNGNYSFVIIGSTIDVFDITITFGSLEFENITVNIQISILRIPTILGVNTLPTNGSLIGDPSPLYYSDNYLVFIEWQNQLNSSGIQDSLPNITGPGEEFLIFMSSFINGTHSFMINTTGVGLYEAQITLGTSGYQSIIYSISFNISLMPTLSLTSDNVSVPSSIYVEETFNLAGTGYQNYLGVNVSTIDSFDLWFNGSIMSSSRIEVINATTFFQIAINTEGYTYGTYNVSLRISSDGYQPQIVNLTIVLIGRELTVEINLPFQTIQQGEDIEIRVILNYVAITTGIGASTLLAPLNNINVHYYIEIEFQNGSSSVIEADVDTDVLGHASYFVEGSTTKSAVGFNNITVLISGSASSLPTSYSMSAEELNLIEITQFLNIFEILIPVLIILLILLIVVTSVYYVNKKRVKRSEVKKFADLTVEKGFEDIKSIRLIIARHQSGLQFYAEKTIAELQADTDALSGMSAAMSSFLEELSDSMTSQADTDEVQARDKIEVMSREGLHMLVWHGNYSSLIIISESRLPDYFQSRLKILGHELEGKFINELKDFYSSDQIPSIVVKRMVRKHIPLHYFCAFVLNEGVLTLDSIKLDRKESKMLKSMKRIMFKIEGVNYFFSEQIISHLSQDYKRSEAIKFLDRAIKINLLIEAEQDDLLRISRR